ncbi:unnamed protein product [Rhizophagus irregularis]|nr:unnamed protein product [Rhizophagus irregularis]
MIEITLQVIVLLLKISSNTEYYNNTDQFLHQKVIVLKDAASVVRNTRGMEAVVVTRGMETVVVTRGMETVIVTRGMGTRGMENVAVTKNVERDMDTVAVTNVRKVKVEMIEINIVVTIEVEIAIAKAIAKAVAKVPNA